MDFPTTRFRPLRYRGGDHRSRAIWLRFKWMSPALLSIRMKSFPAPFIFVKRSMIPFSIRLSSQHRPDRSCSEVVMSSLRIARSAFDDYLSAVKELALGFLSRCLCDSRAHVSFAGDYNNLVLEQIKADAARRPLFRLALCKDPSPIFGTL